MQNHAQALIRDAALLLVLFVVVCLFFAEPGFTAGAGLAGTLIIANLWTWSHIVRWLLQSEQTGALQMAMLVYGFKMAFLLVGLVLVALYFPPVSVLTAPGVLLGAVLVTAARGMVSQPQVGEA